ncbi:MAG: shikimate dehydrogenase [Alphaproteobacteria bacterium]|jgi:shikimate dehydrogenase|nr:shikimate dehydrogenase [Alphaproteobacteria bacterium]
MTTPQDVVRRQLSEDATRAAKLAGVIGWPIGHSLSPRLHGYWLREYAIDGAYVPLAIEPENFAAVVEVLPELGFAGWNVTVPHKEAALAAVSQADDHAAKIGAVNTVVVTGGGVTVGSNTDGFGFMENLRDQAANWDPTSRPAVVVGAGGAAKSVAWALADAGVPELRIVNRTRSRADALATAIGGPAVAVPWGGRADALAGAGLVVNATSLGMVGQPPLDLPLDGLPTNAVVNDLVYAPDTTELLGQAQARGNHTVGGLGMLLHQARRGFAAWFGVEPAVTPALRAHVAAGLGG